MSAREFVRDWAPALIFVLTLALMAADFFGS